MIERVRTKRRVLPSGAVRYELLNPDGEKPDVGPKRKKPNRKRLTEKNVLTLPAKGKQYLVWDDSTGKDAAHGLAVLVSPRCIRSFRCVYYFPSVSKPHWKHLGRVGEMTLAEARKQTGKTRGMSKKGIDPRADDPVKSDGFEAMVGDYIQHVQIGELENRSAHETKAVILNNTKDWWKRPIATIRPDEVEKLLWRVRDGDEKAQLKARPYLANRLHAHLRHLFDWAARPSGPLKESPMARMKKPWRKEKPRERDWFKGKPGDAAIKALWLAAEDIGGDGERYVKMMILTGKRKTALADMRWEEIDDTWYWDAPPSQSKNKRLHGVPLPDLAHRILHPRRASGRVFQELRLDTLLNQVRKASGIDDFFWHGLRHLAETKCAELRDAKDNERPAILPHVRDLLFDHATARGSGRGYDHHDYKFEMREAVEAWAAHVDGVVAAKGVTLLR